MRDEFDSDDTYEVWPALTDLLAAAAMVFLVLLAVDVYQRIRADDERRTYIAELVRALNSARGPSSGFTVQDDGQLVRITLGEDVTFPTGRYSFNDMKPAGRIAVRTISLALRERSIDTLYRQISVVGHTDQVPIFRAGITNWELSAMRAAAVVRLLIYYHGLDPCRVSASGAGPFFPVVRPGSLDHEQNRRIEILILPGRPSSVVGAKDTLGVGASQGQSGVGVAANLGSASSAACYSPGDGTRVGEQDSQDLAPAAAPPGAQLATPSVVTPP